MADTLTGCGLCVDSGGGANIYPAERERPHRDQGALASDISNLYVETQSEIHNILIILSQKCR